jgi:hypothetical protein
MRRNFFLSTTLPSIVAAALLPAGSLWAASTNSAVQDLNQISDQTYQIQARADRLEAYLRSGAHDLVTAGVFINEIAGEAQKLSSLLDQVAAQPGATNDTRMQVKKMKNMTGELMAFAGDTLHSMDAHAMPLHVNDIFTDTTSIEEHCDMIRSAAQALANAR